MSVCNAVTDTRPAREEYRDDEQYAFAQDVIAGFSAPVKHLSPKYFYDALGSQLFEAICATPEYYPTRAETALLTRIASEIAVAIPAGAALVEFGSGASEKTRLLLDAAAQLAVYVPIDISASALDNAVTRLAGDYPQLSVVPQVGDFSNPLQLPEAVSRRTCVGFFPGSTIGNFTPEQAVEFLRSARGLLGVGASFVVGVDLIKDADVLRAAYNDALGITAQFNKNLLTRLNRELGGTFVLDNFGHRAIWNADLSRMEMHLESLIDQTVYVAGRTFHFAVGERLHTENSYKFSVESFTALAEAAGWSVDRCWVTEAPQVALFKLGS